MRTLPFLRTVPPFPAVATKLMRLLASENASFVEAARLLRSDSGLAAELLRVANSALFASRRVDTVLEALSLVGVERVNSLVITLSLCKLAARASRTKSLGPCWRHNLACATLAERLGRGFALGSNSAHTAGLLHDIGRLALLVADPVRYDDLLSNALTGGKDLLLRELDLFGVDHCQAGEMLVEEWGLPRQLAEVVGQHHQPHEKRSMGALVHVACTMADMLGFQAAGPDRPWNPNEIWDWVPHAAVMDWNPDELRFIVAEHINALECADCAVAAA